MAYRVGIVGCGGIAEVHAASLNNMENVELIAFADIRPEKAQNFAERFGGKAYSSLEAMLEAEKLDVVHVCTPHALHVPMVVTAAEHGVNVFCEKPAAVNEEQLQALLAASQKVHVGICFQNRFNDNVQYVKNIIDNGSCGKVLGARAFVTWSRGESYYVDSHWRGTKALECGSALMNQSIHTLDLLTFLLGNPTKVEASMANHHLKGVIETEDTVEAYIQYQDRKAIFYATTANVVNSPVLIEVYTEKGAFQLEGSDCVYMKMGKEPYQPVKMPERKALGKAYWGTGHPICIADFYASLDESKPYYISMEDVARSMRLMFAVYDSAEQHRMVEF